MDQLASESLRLGGLIADPASAVSLSSQSVGAMVPIRPRLARLSSATRRRRPATTRPSHSVIGRSPPPIQLRVCRRARPAASAASRSLGRDRGCSPDQARRDQWSSHRHSWGPIAPAPLRATLLPILAPTALRPPLTSTWTSAPSGDTVYSMTSCSRSAWAPVGGQRRYGCCQATTRRIPLHVREPPNPRSVPLMATAISSVSGPPLPVGLTTQHGRATRIEDHRPVRGPLHQFDPRFDRSWIVMPKPVRPLRCQSSIAMTRRWSDPFAAMVYSHTSSPSGFAKAIRARLATSPVGLTVAVSRRRFVPSGPTLKIAGCAFNPGPKTGRHRNSTKPIAFPLGSHAPGSAAQNAALRTGGLPAMMRVSESSMT